MREAVEANGAHDLQGQPAVNYYSPSTGYKSKFKPEMMFATSEEARAHDRGFVAMRLGLCSGEEFAKAFAHGSPQLREALLFAIGEIPEMAVSSA